MLSANEKEGKNKSNDSMYVLFLIFTFKELLFLLFLGWRHWYLKTALILFISTRSALTALYFHPFSYLFEPHDYDARVTSCYFLILINAAFQKNHVFNFNFIAMFSYQHSPASI